MPTIDRPYKIVYKSKAPPRGEQDDNQLWRQSTRDSDSTFSQTSYGCNDDQEYPSRRPMAPRRMSSDDHFRRLEYSHPYRDTRSTDPVVVEAPRRRGTGGYVVESARDGRTLEPISLNRSSRYDEYDDRRRPRRYMDDRYSSKGYSEDYSNTSTPSRTTESPLIGIRAAPALVSAESYHRSRPDPTPSTRPYGNLTDRPSPPRTIWSPNTDTGTDISSLYARGRSTIIDNDPEYNETAYNTTSGPTETIVRARPRTNQNPPRGRDREQYQHPDFPSSQQQRPTRRPKSILRNTTTTNDSSPSTPSDSRPRRSRSVHLDPFDSDAHDIRAHEAERQKVWHQRPGKEARHAGRYLGHDDDSDLGSEAYFGRRWRMKE